MTDAQPDNKQPAADAGKAAVQPLVYDAAELARVLRVSLRLIRTMDAAGKIPRGLQFGRCKRWAIEDIRRWLEMGGPEREEFERLKDRDRKR